MSIAVHSRSVGLVTVLIVLAASWTCAQEVSDDGSSEREDHSSAESLANDRVAVLIEMIRELDINEDGVLLAHEIPDRALPYVARCARLAGIEASEPLPIEVLEEAVRQHYGKRKSRPPYSRAYESRSRGEAGTPVLGFGPVEGVDPIPGFGEDFDPSVHIEQDDLAKAADRLRQYDKNHDGYLDRREVREGKWYDDPFQYDWNNDNRLSRRELAVRYAKRRSREEGRDGNSSSRSNSENDQQRREAEEQRRRQREEEERKRRQSYYSNRDSWRLAETLMGRYDTNHDGGLDRGERENMGIPDAADADGRGRVDRRELAEWLIERSAKSFRNFPIGLPEWFSLRDSNGDGQIDMVEFADEWTEEKAAEFAKYDLNEDGIVMPKECLKAETVPVGRYSTHQFQIIPARATIYSEIEVHDEVRIADLNVQISITHTWDETLDVFLIGPEGDRIELFTGVGGSDDHFKNTILDDESSTPIVKARPPFAGRYQPESVMKREPSLRTFYGKTVTGTWTLMIRTPRSDRSGVLHGWSLIVTPGGEEKDEEESEEGEVDPEREIGTPPDSYRSPSHRGDSWRGTPGRQR